MTNDPHLTPDMERELTQDADPADVLEQETVVAGDGDTVADAPPDPLPLDANEADVIEQHQEVPEE